jgi:hypothetical protein
MDLKACCRITVTASKSVWHKPYVYASIFAVLSNITIPIFFVILILLTPPAVGSVGPFTSTYNGSGGVGAFLLPFILIGAITLVYAFTLSGAITIIALRRLFGIYLCFVGLLLPIVFLIAVGGLYIVAWPMVLMTLLGGVAGFGLWALLKIGLK